MSDNSKLMSAFDIHGALFRLHGWPQKGPTQDELAVINEITDAYLNLAKRAEEAKRRVRWLESLLFDVEYDVHEMCPFCCSVLDITNGRHDVRCSVFGNHDIKPTPEDFK